MPSKRSLNPNEQHEHGKSQAQRSCATRQSKEVKAHREHSFGRLPE